MSLNYEFMNERTLPYVFNFIEEFYKSSPYAEASFNSEKVLEWLKSTLQADKKKLLVLVALDAGLPVGVISGLANTLPFSDDVIAAEYFWWVTPEYRNSSAGLVLWKGYEWWATNIVKAKGIQMVSLSNLPLGKMYERKGYSKVEEAYIKWL